MSDVPPTVSSVPWLWVIEALASFKGVNTFLLQELIDSCPGLANKLEKITREMLSLRGLEVLFDTCDENVNDDSCDPDTKLGFDLSESCEDVLQHILRGTSVQELRMDRSKLLKWDVQPFIMHKRASLRKCALQQLKDTILDGTHPCAASLREMSGLDFTDVHKRNCDNDGDQNLGVKGTIENRNEILEEDARNVNSLLSKRDRLSADTKNDCDNLQFNSKKLRHHDSCAIDPVKENTVPPEQRELLNDSSETVSPDSKLYGCELAKDRVETGGVECKDLEDYHQHSTSKSRGQNDDNVDESHPFQSQSLPGKNVRHQDISDDEPQQNDSIDRVKNLGERCVETESLNGSTPPGKKLDNLSDEQFNHGPQLQDETQSNMDNREAETSSDCDKYNNERVDVATKKNEFLFSQFAFSRSSVAEEAESWEQNLCMKCSKDGQLLVCTTSTCPLIFHENCLGSSATFDNAGNFYCPFCSYSRAITEYLESKKKASSARKRLAAFLHAGFGDQHKELTKISREGEGNNSIKNGDKDDFVKTPPIALVHEKECNDVNQHNEPIKEAHIKKQAEPSASNVNTKLPCGGNGNVTGERVHGFTGEKEVEEIVIQEHLSVHASEDRDDAVVADSDPHSKMRVKRRRTEVCIQEGGLQREIDELPVKPVCALDTDAENTSEDLKNKSIISKYAIRFRRPEKNYFPYPSFPQLRRIKKPWTVEEEALLKEGVQKFTNINDDRIVPWTKILEFGANVFQKGRTAVDLKDKWRNMCKGSPRKTK